MPNEYKNMWLHNEDNSITVLPYTTLDNIKIDDGEGNFTNFSTNYNQTQTDVSINRNKITQLTSDINSRSKVLYGTEEPDMESTNGDLYFQHNDKEIIKIWQYINGIWYFFNSGGAAGPAISINNIDDSKSKLNLNVFINNIIPDPTYKLDSIYFSMEPGQFAYYNGRGYNKVNGGESYIMSVCFIGEGNTWTGPIGLSKSAKMNALVTPPPTAANNQLEFDYNGDHWYASGLGGYAWAGVFNNQPRFIDTRDFGEIVGEEGKINWCKYILDLIHYIN